MVAVGDEDRARAASLGGVDQLAARAGLLAQARIGEDWGETIAITREALTRFP